MANLKEVRTRIESVNSTKQITSAMKMVASSKLRKSQNAIIAMRPYAEKFGEIMAMAMSDQKSDNVFSEIRTGGRILIVPLSSNKGLCGVFNANVIRNTINLIHDDYQEYFDNNMIDIICIGSKVEEALKYKKYPVVANQNALLDDVTYDNVLPFAEKLIKDFAEKKYDKILFVYNQFKNASTQILVTEQLLPLTIKNSSDNIQKETNVETDFIFQPSKEIIFEEMLPRSLKMQVYKIILDSYTSEQGARMIPMTQATDNATELIKELNLSYNKARQTTITNEIVEIVSGADALNG